MCGIVTVLRRPSDREPPSSSAIVALISEASALVPGDGSAASLTERLAGAAAKVEEANRALAGAPGVRALLADRSAAEDMERGCRAISSALDHIEADLDDSGLDSTVEVESVNAALVRLKDAVWAVHRDRLRTARAVADLGGSQVGPAGLDVFLQIQEALSALDRLEVRGRDSAGVHVLVRDHGLDLDEPSVRDPLAQRADPLFRSRAVRTPEGCLAFVYKAAAEIGELGDNTNAIRESIASDDLLRLALRSDGVRGTVLGHTRWASVGIISEANAHPLNHEERGRSGPYVAGALNGDVDNHADLRAAEGLEIADEITTDAKVIPALVSRRLTEGADVTEAFRKAVASMEGSVAIAVSSAAAPDRVVLALRGSGQALYVGLAEDAFVVASEPYGVVEQCSSYVRMDGETPADPTDPAGSRGQIVVLDANQAGSLAGIERISYDGTPLPVAENDLTTPGITTRDIDRGDYPHYLLKEISESPRSFRKTLRGKLVDKDGTLTVALDTDVIPTELEERLASGEIRRIYVIGQGTAAVAGRSLAAVLGKLVSSTALRVEALPATELSGFEMTPDMSDSLIIAISQSGTTTDTNRTVEVARERGASVLAIVNRRNSDLVDRADGVLYTSDGRDVEMAVASTKAFYAQVAAGFLLAQAIADRVGVSPDDGRQEVLRALRDLPDAMDRVLTQRDHIADVAQRHAPARRYWAVVGNGTNRVAAEEIRIKVSELCYKAVACDVTEDKKHIDLSSEPMILVCAAGLVGSNVDDVAKEIAIYKAHKAAPIVIASEGEERFGAAFDLIQVPAIHPEVAFVLSAMAGHLFGYEAALAIDAQAIPMREARDAVREAIAGVDPAASNGFFERLASRLEPISHRFFEALRTGAYNGHLEASTAVRLASLFRYSTRVTALDAYQLDFGKVGTPSVVVQDLTDALTQAIDELTRPVDAIKHQAKTVTVGISRADETFLQVPLVQEVLGAGVGRDRLSYRTLRALVALDPAVDRVLGYTHYRIDGEVGGDEATVQVTDRGGIAQDIPSRTEREPRLRGTKHRVASERQVLVARGRSDGRTVILIPEVKGIEVTGIALLHVRFHLQLPAPAMRRVLEGYRDRYDALRDLVMETEPTFRDDLLADEPVADLLIDSVQALADRWRTASAG